MFTHPTNPDDTALDSRCEPLADLLSDPHCEHLLRFLQRSDGPVPVATVSRYIVARITDTAATAVPPNVQRRVQTWLHHGQLPALACHGVVRFDPEGGTVELSEGTAVPQLLADVNAPSSRSAGGD